MGLATHLIDTSVLTRMRKPAVADRAVPLVQRGVLALCRPIEMEIVYGARNPEHCAALKEWLLGFELLPMNDKIMERATEVQAALVPSAEHRTVRMPDLLIAATAERSGVTLLHYDRDFDRIARVTGQPTEWIVPPGEADLPVPQYESGPSARRRWAFSVPRTGPRRG